MKKAKGGVGWLVFLIMILCAIWAVYAYAGSTKIKDDMQFEGDVKIVSQTAGDYVLMDADGVEWYFADIDIQFDDDGNLVFGSDDDWRIESDTAKTLELIPATTDETSTVNIGADTAGADFKVFGATTSEYIMYDASVDTVIGNTGNYSFTATDAEANQFKVDATGAVAGYATVLETTDGGIQLNADGSANGDISIESADDLILQSGGIVTVTAGTAAANSVTVTTNAGAAEQIVVTNTQGTNDAAVDINVTAGGFDLDAAKSVALTSSENTADAVQISASAGGIDITATGAASEDLDLTNTNGSVTVTAGEAVADSIVVTSAGGIDITAAGGAAGRDIDIVNSDASINISASEAAADSVVISGVSGGVDISSAATYDIDITATGGTVQLIASEAAANQFKVDAQGAVAGYAIVLETTDGGVQINADGSDNGDITVDAADVLTLSSPDTIIVDGGTLALQFEGTANDYEATVSVTDPTADNTISLPDDSGAVSYIQSSGSTTMAADKLPVPVTFAIVAKTIGDDAEALTLADGENGQILIVEVASDGGGDPGTATLTPSRKTGFVGVELIETGDHVSLLYVDDTIGWVLLGTSGVTAPPAITTS